MRFVSLLQSLVGSLLLSHALATLAGNDAYRVVDEPPETLVYTDGYLDGDDAVTMVVMSDDKILVKTAYNGHDTTDDRLYLNEVLMALWRREGNGASALTYLGWENVNNDEVTDALEGTRDHLGVGSTASFTLKASTADDDIWDLFKYTPFGKVADRICGETGKSVTEIQVTNNRGAETLTWKME